MIKEAIILAGGLGTRLRSAVPDLPKCMAPVAGRPFLGHVIDYLRMQGIESFIFSLGYKAEVIEQYLSGYYPTLVYTTVIEDEPLGTGGAIQKAVSTAITDNVLVTNGDTLFKVSAAALAGLHTGEAAACTLALKKMYHFDRYGIVELEAGGRIRSFKEKQFYAEGLINGGVYLLNKPRFLALRLPEKFSFEKDYLEKYFSEEAFYGSLQDGYFIDIGIPEDFAKAQTDLQKPALRLDQIDKSWTLFLDRDGVINEERLGQYVLHWGEFIFSKGVLGVFKKLSDVFGRIILVTNQRGVSKGLMTETDLQDIHLEMQREVELAGGHIDKIYYCTDGEATAFNRKPNPGMAVRAISDFKDIEPAKSIMVGNKPSDMQFGRSAGLFTVFVTTTNPNQSFPHSDIDLRYDTLAHFANDLKEKADRPNG